MIGAVGATLLVVLAVGLTSPQVLVRATSACFIAVYVAATAAAVKLLRGKVRWTAVPTTLLVSFIAIFSAWYLVVPLVSGACFLIVDWRIGARKRTDAAITGDVDASDRAHQPPLPPSGGVMPGWRFMRRGRSGPSEADP